MSLPLVVPLALVPASKADFAARMKGRAYWVAVYRSGKQVAEWQADWVHLPKRGLAELRLVCPNGEQAYVAHEEDFRLFQFTDATRDWAGTRTINAHVIGVLTDPATGACTLFSYEPAAGHLLGPIFDNLYVPVYRAAARQSPPLDALGVRG